LRIFVALQSLGLSWNGWKMCEVWIFKVKKQCINLW